MNIRPFEKQDAEQVIALWTDCGLTRPWNDPALDIQRKCVLDDGLFLVGEIDGRITGSVMAGYDGHRGWVNYLAIAPHARQSGLGKQIMDDVEARLQALGCPKINLQIRQGNDAVMAFYESLGFTTDACVSMGKRLIPDN